MTQYWPQQAVAALQAGAAVVLDLASWEIVGRFHDALWAVVTTGAVHTLSGNEDEWLALAQHVLVSSKAQADGCSVSNGASSGMALATEHCLHEQEAKSDTDFHTA